jgi:uncharacterized phage protein (TIGR02218 family)
MKPILPTLKHHFTSEVTTIVTCWKVSRIDNVIMGFTDHTSDLIIDNITYKAAAGFSPSSIESSSRFAVDNIDILGILDSSFITESDILSGSYDYAEVEVFQVNYNDLLQGKVVELRGWIGEVSIKGNQFVAEVRSITQKLQQNIGELYSPTCRAVLGDTRCKLDLMNYTLTSTVTNVTNRQTFTANEAINERGYFAQGEVEWLTGGNVGRRMEIKEFAKAQFTLSLPMMNDIRAGDKFKAIAGCDKAFSTCCNKFKNAINFRGEPYIPGMDKMLTITSNF